MDKNIFAAVAQSSSLRLEEHDNGLIKIRRVGMGRGTLWIKIKVTGYTICLTGEVKALMHAYMRDHYGDETCESQGRLYWTNIREMGDVSKIIHRFGSG